MPYEGLFRGAALDAGRVFTVTFAKTPVSTVTVLYAQFAKAPNRTALNRAADNLADLLQLAPFQDDGALRYSSRPTVKGPLLQRDLLTWLASDRELLFVFRSERPPGLMPMKSFASHMAQ